MGQICDFQDMIFETTVEFLNKLCGLPGRILEAKNRQALFLIGALALSMVFVLAVQWRVVTYVCGNDPMLYQRAARVILQPGLYGWVAWRQALTFVAPGYPLFLAFVIGVFGDLAPYWSNFVLLLLLLPLMWWVFWRLTGRPRAAALCVFCSWVIVFSGHPLHAPFILYPFRETFRLLLVYLSFGLLLQSFVRDRARFRWCLGGSLMLIAACLVREPTALLVPGVLLGLGVKSRCWRERVKQIVVFLAPWVLCGLVGFGILQFVELVEVSQFSVVGYLRNSAVALARAKQMAGWLPTRVGGWMGAGLIAIGLAGALWRAPVMLFWFCLPSITLFVFHAFMQMHDRYFLTSVLFMSVFAGLGVDVIWSGFNGLAGRWIRRPEWLRRARCLGYALVFSGMAVAAFLVVRKVAPWGPEIRGRDVREWQVLVDSLTPSADGRIRFAVEQRCRYLEDLLMAYTDVDLLDPKQIDSWPEGWSPAYYFHPLNRAAEYATPQWLMYLQVYADKLLSDRLNLARLDIGPMSIGSGHYQGFRVDPWRAGVSSQLIEGVSLHDPIWLNWGRGQQEIRKQVAVVDGDSGQALAEVNTVGVGLQAVAIPSGIKSVSNVLVQVYSSAPVPSLPVVDVLEGQWFPLGSRRYLAVNLCWPEYAKTLGVQLEVPRIVSNQSVVFSSPELIGRDDMIWRVTLEGRLTEGRDAMVGVMTDTIGAQLRSVTVSRASFDFLVVPGKDAELQFVDDVFPTQPAAFEVDRMGFKMITWDE